MTGSKYLNNLDKEFRMDIGAKFTWLFIGAVLTAVGLAFLTRGFNWRDKIFAKYCAIFTEPQTKFEELLKFLQGEESQYRAEIWRFAVFQAILLAREPKQFKALFHAWNQVGKWRSKDLETLLIREWNQVSTERIAAATERKELFGQYQDSHPDNSSLREAFVRLMEISTNFEEFEELIPLTQTGSAIRAEVLRRAAEKAFQPEQIQRILPAKTDRTENLLWHRLAELEVDPAKLREIVGSGGAPIGSEGYCLAYQKLAPSAGVLSAKRKDVEATVPLTRAVDSMPTPTTSKEPPLPA